MNQLSLLREQHTKPRPQLVYIIKSRLKALHGVKTLQNTGFVELPINPPKSGRGHGGEEKLKEEEVYGLGGRPSASTVNRKQAGCFPVTHRALPANTTHRRGSRAKSLLHRNATHTSCLWLGLVSVKGRWTPWFRVSLLN